MVLSDDDGASARIDEFAAGDARWMVAVRMVSEGVDVPRLSVGVYATSTATPLFFAQAVGRFVRARRRGETASVFLPSVPQLLALAASLELERDHALDRPTDEDPELLLAAAQREESASDRLVGEQGSFEALEAQASFDRVLFDGGEFGGGADVGSDEEADFLGLPGLLEPDQVAMLLRQRRAARVGTRRRGPRQRSTTAGAPSCARSSTRWSARGRGAAVSRTAACTTSCGGGAAARRWPWPRSTRSRRARGWSGTGSSVGADLSALSRTHSVRRTVGIAGSSAESRRADSGSSARDSACRAVARRTPSAPVQPGSTSPSRASGTCSPRVPGSGSQASTASSAPPTTISSAARPATMARAAALRPRCPAFPADVLATGRMIPSASVRATSL